MRKLKKENVKYIIVHCSDTLPGQPCNAEIINDWHIRRGFEMIGYHYVILPDGTIEHGRPLFYEGAHCKAGGRNHDSIGVCYVGGRNAEGVCADTRTEQQKSVLGTLLKELLRRFPKAKIAGHHDFDRGKECPCFDAKIETFLPCKRPEVERKN